MASVARRQTGLFWGPLASSNRGGSAAGASASGWGVLVVVEAETARAAACIGWLMGWRFGRACLQLPCVRGCSAGGVGVRSVVGLWMGRRRRRGRLRLQCLPSRTSCTLADTYCG